jgi:hypothetical protein
MSSQWETFLKDIRDDAGQLLKDEIIHLVEEAKNDSETFLQRQGGKIEKYLNQLATGKISKKQFAGYLRDITALTEMHTLQLSVKARARAQRMVFGITELLINRLLGLI